MHGNVSYSYTGNQEANMRCMVTPVVPRYTTLGVHDVDQIDRTW